MTRISNRQLRISIFLPLALLCLAVFAAPAIAQNVVVTVVGVVTEDSQLVADDGEIYEVAASREGEAVKELLDKRVQVTGSVFRAKRDQNHRGHLLPGHQMIFPQRVCISRPRARLKDKTGPSSSFQPRP